MEDPGSLVQIGFSAGARSVPKFDWVRNITSRKLPAHVIDDMDHRSSSAFALFWNLCRSSLPEEVMEDFDNFFEDCCLPRMHPCNGAAGDPINHSQCMAGDYSIQIGDNKFVFKNAERAPPAGVCGQNYSRFVAESNVLQMAQYLAADPLISSTSPINMQYHGR